jgi:restriction endonuclease S subunit
MKLVELGSVLKQYKEIHHIKKDLTYNQITISQTGKISLRGQKKGIDIGRKRQFYINLKKYPNTLTFIRQGVQKGGIGVVPDDVDGCTLTENMPTFSIENIDVDYLKYLLISPYFKKEVSNLVPVGTAQKAIHEKKLLKIKIPLPDKNIQNNVVNKLNSFFIKIKQFDIKKNLNLIKQIRQSILLEAIQGKLVSQNSNDESASVLLEKIKSEKEKLIKEKKIRKEKPLSEINEDEIPFEVPKGWSWIRFGELCQFNPRNKLDDTLETSFIPMRLIKDGFNNSHTFEIKQWKDIKSGFTHFKENDVVFAKITPCFENRKSAIMSNLKGGYGAGTTEIITLRPFAKSFLPKLLLLYVKTESFIRFGLSTYTGTAGQQRINVNKIKNLAIGLPPLNEQNKIVAKVDQLMKLCDELEFKVKENQVNSEKLMNAVLKEEFNET